MLSMQGLSLICLIYMPKVSEKKTNVMFENIYLALLCKTFHKLLFPVYIQCTHDYANKTLILNCKMASRLLCTQNACTKRCWVMLLNRDVAPPYRSLEILPCLWNVSSLLNNHTRLVRISDWFILNFMYNSFKHNFYVIFDPFPHLLEEEHPILPRRFYALSAVCI